jgi:hypothetical protein
MAKRNQTSNDRKEKRYKPYVIQRAPKEDYGKFQSLVPVLPELARKERFTDITLHLQLVDGDTEDGSSNHVRSSRLLLASTSTMIRKMLESEMVEGIADRNVHLKLKFENNNDRLGFIMMHSIIIGECVEMNVDLKILISLFKMMDFYGIAEWIFDSVIDHIWQEAIQDGAERHIIKFTELLKFCSEVEPYLSFDETRDRFLNKATIFVCGKKLKTHGCMRSIKKIVCFSSPAFFLAIIRNSMTMETNGIKKSLERRFMFAMHWILQRPKDDRFKTDAEIILSPFSLARLTMMQRRYLAKVVIPFAMQYEFYELHNNAVQVILEKSEEDCNLIYCRTYYNMQNWKLVKYHDDDDDTLLREIVPIGGLPFILDVKRKDLDSVSTISANIQIEKDFLSGFDKLWKPSVTMKIRQNKSEYAKIQTIWKSETEQQGSIAVQFDPNETKDIELDIRY